MDKPIEQLAREMFDGFSTVACKPFDFDAPIPPRKLIEINGCKSYAQGFLSVTGAAGGTGKSSLAIIEELSLAMGVDLFKDDRPPLKCGRKRVWSMSLEDDEQEHRRRVIAAMRHYHLSPGDLAGHYLVTYKSDSPIEVGTVDRSFGFSVSPQVKQIKAVISEMGVHVINVDPFVNTHGVPENDNGAMNKVADVWRSIAQESDVAINLTHHIRKSNSVHEVGAEDLRGAGSLVSAARIVRVLAPMNADEAKGFGIEDSMRRFYFWVNPTGKSNITPPATTRYWYHMTSVNLENGTPQWDDDSVGVVESWSVPNGLEGLTADHVRKLISRLSGANDEFLFNHCRKSSQAKASWIGGIVAEILGVDIDDTHGCARVNKVIKYWLEKKVLEEAEIHDKSGRPRPCLRLGSACLIPDVEF